MGMGTHVALLRGINLGGRNRMAMSDLREVAASLGWSDLVTYLQSGNLAFSPPSPDGVGEPAALASSLRAALAETLDFAVPVVVVSRERLDRIVVANPYPEEPNPKCVHAVFHQEPPGPERAAAVAEAEEKARAKGGRDRADVVDGVALYLHTPDGFGRSDLALQLSRVGGPGGDGTARNWTTVEKLAGLLRAGSARP